MVKAVPGESYWVSYIKKRIRNNLNFLGMTTGPTGGGKSFSGLSTAQELDPEFSVEQICFGLSQLMPIVKKYNNVDPNYKPKEGQTPLHKRKYKVILFEETQTSVNKRDWQSKTNKMFLYLMSTFRHQNIIVLFNSPYSDYFDGSTMKLIHAKFECKGWSKKTKKTYLRGKLLQYNDKLKKFYEHSLYVIENGKAHKFDGLWGVSKASDDLIEPYEIAKANFTNKLNDKIAKEFAKLDIEDDSNDFDTRKPLTDRQKEVMECLAKGNTQLQAVEILGLANGTIAEHKKAAVKKGYTLQEFADAE